MKRFSKFAACSIILVVGAYMMFSGFAYRPAVSVAYVDTERIFGEYRELVDASEKLEAEREKYEKEFSEMQDEYFRGMDEFASQQMLMSDQRKQQRQNDLRELFRRLNEYQAMHFGPEGTLAVLADELTDPVLEIVRTVIKEVGEMQGYDFVLDGNADVVLYSNEDFDITDTVLAELKK